MNVFGEIHWDACNVLPVLLVAEAGCESCDETHGVALVVGWLFFSVHFVFWTTPTGGHA